MRKSFIIMALLTAATTASAQMTPEAWIGNYPSLPSIKDIIAYDKDQRNPDSESANENLLFDLFIEKVDEVSVKGSEMMGKTAKAEQQAIVSKVMAKKTGADKKGSLSQELILKLQHAQKDMSETSRLWTEKAQLKELRAYGDSLWQHKYAPEYDKLLTERQHLQEKMDGKQWDEAHTTGQTAAEVKALEDKLEANTNALYDTENAFYEEYIPLYHRALGDVLDYIRGTMMPAYRLWKTYNDEAYKQTGDSKWMISDAQIAVPADAYASVLKMIEDYSLNNAETPFHQAE